MQTVDLLITPRDPLLFRDGRPFNADPGAAARSLPWPMPSTCAGALRTHIGNACSWNWFTDGPDKAKRIGFQGPFLVARSSSDSPWEIYFHAPADAVVYELEKERGGKETKLMRLRPWKLPEGAGCDLPHKGLLPLKVTTEQKPKGGCDFWSFDDTVRWLASGTSEEVPQRSFGRLLQETRVHVKIDPDKGTSQEGMLFSVSYLVFPDVGGKEFGPHSTGILCRVFHNENWRPAPSALTLGGERRLAYVQEASSAQVGWPQVPDLLRNALAETRRLRIQLVTPALFAKGWCPGWLDENLEGCPPGIEGLKLRLVAAAVPRRIPVSGWHMDRRNGKNGEKKERGPKPPRYTAPAGSVFFFEVIEGSVSPEALWLAQISDNEQDRRDGFGTMLPGVWDYAE